MFLTSSWVGFVTSCFKLNVLITVDDFLWSILVSPALMIVLFHLVAVVKRMVSNF